MSTTKIVRGLSQNASKVLSSMNGVQAQYLTEACIAVDESDRPLRSVSKYEAHHASSAILHRAFSVFLFTPNQELVLQKRSDTKITFPSVWTNSCCSHPLYVDNEMEVTDSLGVRRAAQRKLDHELGVGSIDIDRMKVMGRFLYKAEMEGAEWIEHELDYAIIVRDFDVNTLNINPEEASEVRSVSKEGLAQMISSDSERFSPWFSLFYKEKWLSTWWDNLSNLDAFIDLKPVHRLQC
ncbi:hypothetical protein QR680_013571 [Steinernema hermaphroditum]|uniref:isopentenyl-diphosphate Delta-isomerase n=1 Tax=Steinernema hermaphroditum TaxID=289476 RepID=A0AA39I5Z6_9BILA|nr:hypothetical protein QR680_013571 [Steinernema hermaphroditum]